MNKPKTIALVAHDNKKKDLIEWVEFNWAKLIPHDLICTGTTGRLVQEALAKKLGNKALTDLSLTKLKSGPLGGDQQLGALISDEKVDLFIFIWDPMSPQPHDVDVQALLRIAALYNVPTATNKSTADFLITSPLFEENYDAQPSDVSNYLNRSIPT